MVYPKKIEIEEMLTPLKVKVIYAFKKHKIIQFKDLVNLTGLDYRQVEWVAGRLTNVHILERVKWGTYKLTERGDEYVRIIDLLNLSSKNNFKLIGTVDVDTFLNGTVGASILGGLLSDGSVSKNKIKFLTTDTSLNHYVWGGLSGIFNKDVNMIYGYMDGRLNVEFLKLFTPTYRGKPFRKDGKIISWTDVKIPDFIMNGTKEQKIEFLRTYASCDGGVVICLWWDKKYKLYYLNAWVLIACENPTLRQQLSELLGGISFIVNTKDESQLLLLGENVEKFQSIGFVEGCRAVHGKYWKGFEKNDLLDLAILIKKIGPDIIPPYLRVNKNNHKEILEYLKYIVLEIKKNGLSNVIKKFSDIKDENKLLRKIPISWINILELLEDRDISFTQIIDGMIKRNYKDSFKKARSGISSILSRLKKRGLINNKTLNHWRITEKGKSLLVRYRKQNLSEPS